MIILICVYIIAVVADSRAKVIVKQQTINEQYNSDSDLIAAVVVIQQIVY